MLSYIVRLLYVILASLVFLVVVNIFLIFSTDYGNIKADTRAFLKYIQEIMRLNV